MSCAAGRTTESTTAHSSPLCLPCCPVAGHCLVHVWWCRRPLSPALDAGAHGADVRGGLRIHRLRWIGACACVPLSLVCSFCNQAHDQVSQVMLFNERSVVRAGQSVLGHAHPCLSLSCRVRLACTPPALPRPPACTASLLPVLSPHVSVPSTHFSQRSSPCRPSLILFGCRATHCTPCFPLSSFASCPTPLGAPQILSAHLGLAPFTLPYHAALYAWLLTCQQSAYFHVDGSAFAPHLLSVPPTLTEAAAQSVSYRSGGAFDLPDFFRPRTCRPCRRANEHACERRPDAMFFFHPSMTPSSAAPAGWSVACLHPSHKSCSWRMGSLAPSSWLA